MKAHLLWLFQAVGLALVLGVAGCGPGGNYPEMAPVTVTVLYEGQAVEGATVLLSPADPENRSAQGRTDASGRASLRSFPEREGVLPGTYRVAIHKATQEGVEEEVDPDADPGAAPQTVHHLPQRYASVTTSDLSIDVALGEPMERTFELTD